jgi:hypothetical protein
MKTHRTTRAALVVLTTAAIIAHAALGAGEPKNESPFTRPVAGARTAVHLVHQVAGAALTIAGEPKNELPFTRPSNDDPGLAKALHEVSVGAPALTGERKSGPPFSDPVDATVAVVGGGFNWSDAAIGMLVAAGIGIGGAGVYMLTRTRPARREEVGTPS